MPSTGIIDGHDMRWFLDGTAIAKATSCSISITSETRESTNKDSTGSWSTKKYGRKSFTGTCDALYAEGEQLETLFTALNADTILSAEFTTGVTGDKFWDAEVLVTGIEMNADDNEDVTYSVTFEGTGALVRGTEA